MLDGAATETSARGLDGGVEAGSGRRHQGRA